MAKSITFSCYGYKLTKTKTITKDFELFLGEIYTLSPEDKVFLIKGKEIHLENLLVTKDYCFFDFALRTPDGPNKAKKYAMVEPIDLSEDEEFAYQTAGVYSISNAKLAIQFNIKGPKVSDIEEYLGKFLDANQEFELRPILSNDYEKFIGHANKIRTFGAKIDLEKIDKNLIENDATLAKAISMGNKVNTGYLELKFSVKPKGKLNTGIIKRVTQILSGLPEGAVASLKSTGEYDDANAFDLELLDGLIVKERHKVANVKGCIPTQTRYGLLEATLRNIS